MLSKVRMRKEKGFTLIELMIVVAIIGILAAIAVPNFIAYRNKSRIASCVSTTEGIRASMAGFAADSVGNVFPQDGDLASWDAMRGVMSGNGISLKGTARGQNFQDGFTFVEGKTKSTSPGLAHALDSAYHLIKGKTVFFGMADTLMKPNDIFKRVFEAATPEDDVLFGMFTTDRPEKFGMVRMDGKNRVIQIDDKPKQTDLTQMWGCIVWRPKFTEYMHKCVFEEGISDFAKIMNDAIAMGMKFKGVHMEDGTYIDLGTYDEIADLDRKYRGEE